MSLGEADAKFPTAHEGTGLPPPPSAENPGQVFPKSDPNPAPVLPSHTGPEHCVGNPYLLHSALRKVDHAFGEVIALFEDEEVASCNAEEENPLLRKFRRWREELDVLRGGFRTPPDGSRARTRSRSPVAGGGMFVD